MRIRGWVCAVIWIGWALIAGAAVDSREYETARTYLRLRMIREAVAAWESIREREPGRADVHYGAGLAYLLAERYDEAADALTEALRLDPRRAEFAAALGRSEAGRYRFEAALDAVDRAIALQPDAAPFRFQRGEVLAALGRTDEAIAEIERARDLGYDPVACDAMLGRLLSRQGKLKSALERLDAVLRLDPGHVEARFLRSRVRRRLGDEAGAERDLVLHTRLQERAKAIDAIRAELRDEESPERRIRLYTALGRALLSDGDAQQARSAFRAALLVAPNDLAARTGFGAASAALGDFDAAERAAERVLEQNPQLPEAEALLGTIAYRRGDFDRAVRHLERALARRPELRSARRTLAEALLSKGDTRAISVFREAIRRDPDDPLAAEGLARALARLGGDLSEALEYARRAVSRRPFVARLQNTYALIAFRLGRLDEAESAIRLAIELDPENRNYRAGLEAIRAASGR